MSFFNSIKWRVWLRFELIVAAILAVTYVFMVVLFPYFYEWTKVSEINRSLERIQSVWQGGSFEKVKAAIDDEAYDKKMYIEAYLPQYGGDTYKTSGLLDSLPAIASVDKSGLMDEINEADDGVVSKVFHDDTQDNSLLLVGSVIGEKDSPQAYIFICNYLQPLGTTLRIFRLLFFIVSVITFLLSTIAAVFISLKIAKPIIRVENAARELPRGEFDAAVQKGDYAEIIRLAQTLQTASGEIAKSKGFQRELMSNISHDLRTPLTMIKAYAEMIRDISGDSPEKREKHLKVIIEEADRLSALVTDILDLSQLQSGVTEMSPETFDLSERLCGVVSRFDIVKLNDGIIIELHAEPRIYITADATKLDQVIYNLINNAVTYAGEDRLVIVSLSRGEGGKLRFAVTDHGEGIPQEFLPNVWERYYKVNSPHKRAKSGSGIGLSIVKSILERHGFAYGAESSVGAGSTFWFEAPECSPEKVKAARAKRSDKK